SSSKSLYGKRKGSSKEGKKYEKKLSSLEQSFDIGRISEANYIKTLKKLSTKTKTTLDQWRGYQKSYYDYVNERATTSLDSRIEALNTESGYTKSNINKMSKAMKAYYKYGKISIDQYHDYQKQVTKAGLEYSLNAYEKQGGSFTALNDKLKKALNKGKITSGEYYQYLDDLIEKASEKEQERFEKYQEQQEAKRQMLEVYAEKQKKAIQSQIDDLEKQKTAQDEANEASDRANQLAEKEQALATARGTRIRRYREGVGYVWESDIQEVSKAQKELDDLKKQFADEDTTKAIDKQIEELEKQQQAWDDYIESENEAEQIRQLEKEAGISFGSITSGLGILLTEAFKSKYNTAGELAHAYEDIANAISDGKIKINTSTGKIDKSTLDAYINKNKYADGTMGARGGLSLVGEKGAEWRVLNKGDGIIPNTLTKNLMELGKFNPSQWQAIMAKDMSSKSDSIAQYYYNFDKLVLPNVQDANALLRELQQLSNKAIQSSKKRT
ncbi:MAG: hypothetical protein PHN69_07670, partial [Candidatus Pacebacteria bacterium]|nr:hypothetical protein [Candidatus Paceibacterota bacterium]